MKIRQNSIFINTKDKIKVQMINNTVLPNIIRNREGFILDCINNGEVYKILVNGYIVECDRVDFRIINTK